MNESTDHLRDAFRAMGRRLTSQRRLILEVLRERGDEHLDAEELFVHARVRDADVSLATVYRTLAVLKEMGLAEEHRLGEEHSHYEAVRDAPHYHFTCLGCGRVIEFDAPLVKRIERELNEREGVLISNTHLHVSGYCAQCGDQVGGQNNNGE